MLVDTDVLIWFLRGNERAAEFLALHPGFALSAVTYMELVQGMRNRQELMSLRRGLKGWRTPVLPLGEGVSQRAILYVEEYFLSHSLRLADALIAATATEHGLPLATGNARHYRVIPELVLERFRP